MRPLDHPDTSFDSERDAQRFAEVVDGPQHVGVGPRAIVAAEDAAWLYPGEPVCHVGVEDGVVMHAVQKHQIQAIHRPVEEIIGTAPLPRRDVFTTSRVIVEVISRPPGPFLDSRLAKILPGNGVFVALGRRRIRMFDRIPYVYAGDSNVWRHRL